MRAAILTRFLQLLPLAVAAVSTAQTQPAQTELAFLTARAFRTGAAEPDVILLNPESGELAIGAALPGSADIKWNSYPGVHFYPLNPDALRTGDLNGDGNDELILSSFKANRIGVVWGQTALTTPPLNDEFVLGAGPAGAEPILLASGPDHLAAALVAGNVPRLRLFELPGSRVSGTADLDPVAALGYGYSTASVPPTIQASRLTQFLALATTYIDDSGEESTPTTLIEAFGVEVGGSNPTAPSAWSNITLKRGYVDLAPLWDDRPNILPWFVAWEPENSVIDVINPTASLRFSQTPPPSGLSTYKDVTTMLHNQGQSAGLYDFDPAIGFVLRETLTPPTGERFANVLALAEDRLFASMSLGGAGFLQDTMSNDASVPYAIYADKGDGFEIVAQGNTPLFSKSGAHATVTLFTGDPLGGDAFEFETFLTGDWARNASLSGGQINVTSESYLGSVIGLGNPTPVPLTPTNTPGPGAAVLANQFGDTGSSLFFNGAVTADGNAAVTIAPPPGSYDAPVPITFIAPAGTSVMYRVNGQPWQAAGLVGFFVSSDAAVDYYGQAASGALGSIQSASYEIALSLTSDSNHDFLPDAIAVALGLDPFGDQDADGDGYTNAEEVFNGSDPTTPNSVPGVISVVVIPPLSFDVRVFLPDAGGGLADIPASEGNIRVFSPVEGEVGDALVGNNGIAPVTVADYYGENDTRSVHARSGQRFYDALIVEISVPAQDGGTPIMLGFAMPPGFDLPAPPPPSGPVPIPYPNAAQLAQWIEDVTVSLDAFSETRGLDPDGNTVEITPDTTLALAALSAWVSQQLTPEREARIKVRFPWLNDAAARAITRLDLTMLEEPQGSELMAHELTHVVQQFHSEIVNNPAYLPLRAAAREMILFATDPDRPVVLGQVWNAPKALIQFFETGALDGDWGSAVSAPPATLLALRDQLLASPQPRPVLDFNGTLVLLPDQTWAARDAGGNTRPLRGHTVIAEVVNGETSLRHVPAELALYAYTGFLPGMTVHVTGFPASRGDPMDIELLALTIIETDFRAGILDSDDDGMDDGFEQRFLNSLASGFWDDTDGDGFADGEEYLALTDPSAPVSTPPGRPAFPRDLTVSISDGVIILAWEGGTQATYTVQYGLATGWLTSTLIPTQLGNGSYEWRTALDGIPADFFRVVVTLE